MTVSARGPRLDFFAPRALALVIKAELLTASKAAKSGAPTRADEPVPLQMDCPSSPSNRPRLGSFDQRLADFDTLG